MGIANWFIINPDSPQNILTRDLLSIAIADGDFSDNELATIRTICRENGISDVELMDSLRGTSPTAGLKLPRTKAEKEDYIRYLTDVMGADGKCSIEELHILERIAKKIGFDKRDLWDFLQE